MKLTWFGKGSFRVHAGGRIVVVDPGAPDGVNRAELVSGADLVVEPDTPLPQADGRRWTARPAGRLLDAEEEAGPARVFSLGAGALLLETDGERPLLVLNGPVPELGRWVERAVVVIAGDGLAARAAALVAERGPRLLALAGADGEIEAAFAALRDGLEGTGLVALERGMAVEV